MRTKITALMIESVIPIDLNITKAKPGAYNKVFILIDTDILFI